MEYSLILFDKIFKNDTHIALVAWESVICSLTNRQIVYRRKCKLRILRRNQEEIQWNRKLAED